MTHTLRRKVQAIDWTEPVTFSNGQEKRPETIDIDNDDDDLDNDYESGIEDTEDDEEDDFDLDELDYE